MSRGSRVASVLIFVSVAGASLARAQQAVADPNVVRLITVKYADGRTIKTPIRDTGWVSWTPAFPRIAGAHPVEDGLALAALQLEHAIDGRDLVVTVALLYGTPHQKRVPVVSVRLTGDQPVRVDELAAFGVQPITLAIISMARPQLTIPAVTLPSSLLEATVDVDTRGAPRYLISITNRAQQGVMALAFQGYHGNTKGISGKPHTPGHTALIAPGESYTIVLTPSLDPRAMTGDVWAALDRVVFTSVTWSDGIVEGSERPAIETRVVDAATARQLARALAFMRGAQTGAALDLPQLRSAISSLPIDDADAARAASADPNGVDAATATSLTRIGTQIAKDAVLNDFDEFLRDPRSADPATCRTWLTSAVTKFDGWRTRIVTAPR